MKTENHYEENEHKYSHTNEVIIYSVNSRDNTQHLGWIIFNCTSTITKFSFGDLNGVIQVNLHFIDLDSENAPRLNQFFGSISSNSHSLPRASISKPSAEGGFGGIYLEPACLSGNRIGGLIMDTIINWLKTFNGSTLVNRIRFDPVKEIQHIVEAFYKKFAIPLKDETTIENLIVNDSWKKNISEFDITNIFDIVWESEHIINFYQTQNEYLSKLNKKIEKESTSWRSIFFGGKKQKNIKTLELKNKDVEYYKKINELKTLEDIDAIFNLFKKYKTIKRIQDELIRKNENLKNNFHRLNKINVKKFKVKYMLQKIFINQYSFWVVLFISLIINYKEQLIF